MSYLVFVTFDLKGASSQDYTNAYADLEKLGLRRVNKSGQGGDVVIPTTSVMGFFDGTDGGAVWKAVSARVENAFAARRLKSEIFIVVGKDWAWGAATT